MLSLDTLSLTTSFDSSGLLYKGRSLPIEDVADILVTPAERSLCR